MAEIVGLDSEGISFFLQLSEMTIRRYVKKFRDFGEVSTAIIDHIIVYFHRDTRTNEYAGMLNTRALILLLHHANVNQKRQECTRIP